MILAKNVIIEVKNGRESLGLAWVAGCRRKGSVACSVQVAQTKTRLRTTPGFLLYILFCPSVGLLLPPNRYKNSIFLSFIQ